MISIGICGVIGGLCVLFLPETANAPLKDTIRETIEDDSNRSADINELET